MSSNAKISIIILNLNRADLTCDCVKSVLENTEVGLYEMIVVDNGSSAEQLQRLVFPPSVTLLRLNRNVFFGEASNIGAEHANGEYVVFLNNDVKVTSGWLTEMLGVFEHNAHVGAVGPKYLFPDRSLQEAGAFISPEGDAVQFRFEKAALATRYVAGIQVVDYCSAACLLMKKRDFLGLGGFDPMFEPAYFEDVDLALRLRSVGLFSYYYGQVEVFHEKNATARQIWTLEQLSSYFAANHRKFASRWADYLQRRMREPCEPEPLPPVAWKTEGAPGEKRRIILFSSNPVDASEASRRLLLVACAFQDTHDVIIAADAMMSRCRIYSLCREFRIELVSFRTRNISDVSESRGDLMITFDIDGSSCGNFKSQIKFECDGDKLLALLE